MRIHGHPSETRVRALLEAANLPTADLTSAHLEHFFGCGDGDAPQGVIGVELHGENALLRSLAVAESARGRGCGKALVDSAERHARNHGARHMFLLTTAAEKFFAKIGYARVARDTVPETIRATQEFAALCPGSAAAMAKDLSH